MPLKAAPQQVVAPGDDVRPGDAAELLRLPDAGEAHEVGQRVLVGAPRGRAAEVGEPLQLGRHVGQALEGLGRQQPAGAGTTGKREEESLMVTGPCARRPGSRRLELDRQTPLFVAAAIA